jgi:hypothetical protein
MAAVKRKGPSEEEFPQEPKVPEAPANLEQQIMKQLGTPPNFYKCQVINVGDQRWRVNVRISVRTNDIVTVTTVAHSFYIKTNEKGKIIGGDEIVPTYKV